MGVIDLQAAIPDRLLTPVPSLPSPGYARTDATGGFVVSYALRQRPDLVIHVFDRVMRRLPTSLEVDGLLKVFADVQAEMLQLPEAIVVLRAAAQGWLVTQGTLPNQGLSTGNTIEFLIDNENAWSAVTKAVDATTKNINVMLFYLDVGHAIVEFEPQIKTDGTQKPTPGARLEERFAAAAQSPREVAVRLLVNDFVPLGYPMDTARRVASFFAQSSNQAVEVRSFRTPQALPIHAKVFIFDDTEAIVVGSPFAQDYFDSSEHRWENPRHGGLSMCTPIKVPKHDVSVRVKGPAVAALNETFRLHWNRAKVSGQTDLPDPGVVPPAQPGGVSVQVVRTLTGSGRFAAIPHGETGILEGYLRAIRNAEKFIYLENQYFTCHEIAEALVFAVRDAIRRGSPLQVIILINNKVDIPFYGNMFDLPLVSDGWQVDTLRAFLKELGSDGRERVGLFTLWTHDNPTGAGKTRLVRTFVHTKAAIVDDLWVSIGSANLDGVSLLASEHALAAPAVVTPDNPHEARATEVNLQLFNGVDGQPGTDQITDLRRALWSEHLGYAGPTNPLPPLPAEGWLALWRMRALEKQAGMRLGGVSMAVHPARVLMYPHTDGIIPRRMNNTEHYLSALDIDVAQLDLKETFRPFSFKEGTWEGT